MNNEILGYKFKNSKLLEEALTHPSICVKNNSKITRNSYERLEFLGDAALSLVISDFLMEKFPEEDEGKLAKRRSGLVSGEMLAKIATRVNLGEKIEMAESERKLDGHKNANNLENALEAVIGAIYLDSGIEETKRVVKHIWQPYIEEMIDVPSDPKSKLQEILQKNGKPLPLYELVESSGPKHMLKFKIRLTALGFEEVIGEGKSKQQAEKEAATLLLKNFDNI